MILDYFYGQQADMFSFIRIPKLLLTGEMFKDISFGAKILYGILLDRMSLSIKNRWIDSENRVFIIYKLSDIEEELAITEKMAIKYMRELEQGGLIEKKRRGLGLPSLLYVKTFVDDGVRTSQTECSENEYFRPSQNDSSRPSQIDSSRTAQKEVQDLPESTALINNTKLNNTESEPYLISSYPDESDEMDEDMLSFRVKTQIDYDSLVIAHPMDRAFIDCIVELISEVLAGKSSEIQIASSTMPMGVVKSRFKKIKFLQIEYVLDCFHNNHSKVKNIKKYLLAILYNAPATMEGYYEAAVNFDMANA